uniref:HMG box domain-containing protein n=1 Tax=Glossina brevipalpis TaxID=37001 RepID=A0A1A9X042_9MUSC
MVGAYLVCVNACKVQEDFQYIHSALISLCINHNRFLTQFEHLSITLISVEFFAHQRANFSTSAKWICNCIVAPQVELMASLVIVPITTNISATAVETITEVIAATSSDGHEDDSRQQMQIAQQESTYNPIISNCLPIVSPTNTDNSSTMNPIIITSPIASVSHPTENNMIRAGGGGGGGGKADAKPRGRMTAYAYFVQTCREEHKKKHPDETVIFAEFSRKCAERWKFLLNLQS